MGVYIKGMEIPTARDTLVLVKTDGTAIVYEDEAYVTTAVPVPDHGRLIDADALIREQGFHDYKYVNGLVYVSVCEVVHLINAAPTIIPADLPKEEA